MSDQDRLQAINMLKDTVSSLSGLSGKERNYGFQECFKCLSGLMAGNKSVSIQRSAAAALVTVSTCTGSADVAVTFAKMGFAYIVDKQVHAYTTCSYQPRSLLSQLLPSPSPGSLHICSSPPASFTPTSTPFRTGWLAHRVDV
jgi:hypothetical protein